MALVSISTYIAIFFNTFVNPIALDSIAWKYYIVFAVILAVITVTIYFFYPETKGHTLEEMTTVFDGEEALDGIKGTNVKYERKEAVQHDERV
jgi:hypothetical protein